MINGWQAVQLGDVLQRVKVELAIDDSVTYKQVTVRLWNKGVILRGEQEGIDIKTKRQFYVKTGQLLMSRIDVRNGAIGLVPKELDGAIVSNDFWVYDFDESKLFPKFLAHYVTTPSFIEDADRTSSGTTKRIRAEETAFLNIKIPLPPLDEQRRIVERVEALAARIAEAQSLREEIHQESESLLRSILADKSFGEPVPTPMREIVKLREPDVIVDPNETYHFAGVYSFGHGIFRGIRKMGNQFAYPKLTRLRTNEFTYPKLMAWEGAYAIVSPECDGLVVSTEFPVFELNQEKILPETMGVYFCNPAIWETLSGQSTGTNVRRRRLNPQTFLNYEFPLPPMKQQLVLRSVQARLASLRHLQTETQEELDALLPSVLDRAFKGEL